MTPNSRDFFSFRSPSGRQYRYKWLPHGFTNSPSIMSRVTCRILSGLPTSARAAKVDKADEEAASEQDSRKGKRKQEEEEDPEPDPDDPGGTRKKRKKVDPRTAIYTSRIQAAWGMLMTY